MALLTRARASRRTPREATDPGKAIKNGLRHRTASGTCGSARIEPVPSGDTTAPWNWRLEATSRSRISAASEVEAA